MLNLLFSPNGRIAPAEFLRGAFVLIGLGALVQLMPLISMKLSFTLMLPALVMYWCWVVLWVKRFHDGNQSGWMCLVAILVWIVVGAIAGQIMQAMFMGDVADQAAEMLETMEDMDEDDVGGMFSAIFDMVGGTMKQMAIPNAITTTLVSLGIVYGGNALIKHDPEANQYDADGVGNTFD